MEQAVLIYDGNCPLCLRARDWVAKRARAGTIELLMCQSVERIQRFPGISEQACLEAVQLVLADGAVYAGAEALPHILRRMRGWRWLAGVVSAPGIAALMPFAYRWVARRRSALSVFFRKKQAGPRCREEGDCR